MKPQNLIFRICFILSISLCSFCKTEAQNTFVTTGNSVSGSGGIGSYSVGQTISLPTSGSNGNAFQGIQFAFNDSTLSIVDLETNLEISTYPNPTTSVLNIKTTNFKENDLSYSLFDISGKKVKTGKVVNTTTPINVDNIPTATYILKIKDQTNQKTKTFKIIKK